MQRLGLPAAEVSVSLFGNLAELQLTFREMLTVESEAIDHEKLQFIDRRLMS